MLTACIMLSTAAAATVPTAAAAADNLITNSTFDSGTTDWAISYKKK